MLNQVKLNTITHIIYIQLLYCILWNPYWGCNDNLHIPTIHDCRNL